jgi:hypothetical protein
MIKYTRLFITILLAVCVLEAKSQSTATTSSPYSRYGIGDVTPQWLPQNIGMGGIATATNGIGGYNTINLINPAAYGSISYTVIDAGIGTNLMTLHDSTGAHQRTGNTKLSHLSFAFPITTRSSLGLGLVPYSDLGYHFTQTFAKGYGSGSKADTNAVNQVYSGDGSLSKAYLGYGFAIGKHLTVGGNVSYIFGNLKQYQDTEIPNLANFLNSRIEEDNHVGGFNFDYGAQYTIDFSTSRHLILGYSASVGNKINVQHSFIVSQYTYDSSNNQNNPVDSLINTQDPKAKIQLPRINHFGIAYQKDQALDHGPSYLVGVDYTAGNWHDLTIAGAAQGLQNSKMFNIGGQITPNPNALSSYLLLMSYQLGFIYEDTYLNVNNTSIKSHAFTFGLGIPIPHDRATSAFYKVNFAGEIGQRGTISNGLVKENYVNFHLSFTLNDRWFQRYKFD